MKTHKFLISLTTESNDYQRELAKVAEETAKRLGVDVQILFAQGDAINQSQQLLSVIQAPAESRPDGIMVLPVGTTLEKVATAAVNAGIGWALLNRSGEYIPALRRSTRVPVFSVSVVQEEVGRIQGQQFAALLPRGGTILYIMGPASNASAVQRLAGVEATKPHNITLRTVRAAWTEQSAYNAISAWLQLSTSRTTPFSLIGSQNDVMAIGARKAFDANTSAADRERWCHLPFTGVDAVTGTGKEWIRKGLLTASVELPISSGIALELFARAFQTNTLPPENTPLKPVSYPTIDTLKK